MQVTLIFGLFGEYFPADETRQKILKMGKCKQLRSKRRRCNNNTSKNYSTSTFHVGPLQIIQDTKVTVDGQNYVLQTFQMYTNSNTVLCECDS